MRRLGRRGGACSAKRRTRQMRRRARGAENPCRRPPALVGRRSPGEPASWAIGSVRQSSDRSAEGGCSAKKAWDRVRAKRAPGLFQLEAPKHLARRLTAHFVRFRSAWRAFGRSCLAILHICKTPSGVYSIAAGGKLRVCAQPAPKSPKLGIGRLNQVHYSKAGSAASTHLLSQSCDNRRHIALQSDVRRQCRRVPGRYWPCRAWCAR